MPVLNTKTLFAFGKTHLGLKLISVYPAILTMTTPVAKGKPAWAKLLGFLGGWWMYNYVSEVIEKY